jgi:hypothetical protein
MIKKISSKYFTSDWLKDLSDINSPNWTKGIGIIKDRFESRYFNPIDLILNSSGTKIKYTCGFLVMSIDCLLIETLNQFYLGLYTSEERYYRRNPDINYKKNEQAFRDFFKHSTFFPDFKDENMSNIFYKEIRCGLLHQAQSKTNSLINIKETKMVALLDSKDPSKGLIINRNLFHTALKYEFNKYLNDLESPTNVNIFGENLREKCNRKMIGLCS